MACAQAPGAHPRDFPTNGIPYLAGTKDATGHGLTHLRTLCDILKYTSGQTKIHFVSSQTTLFVMLKYTLSCPQVHTTFASVKYAVCHIELCLAVHSLRYTLWCNISIACQPGNSEGPEQMPSSIVSVVTMHICAHKLIPFA